jgi:hypothetical protein
MKLERSSYLDKVGIYRKGLLYNVLIPATAVGKAIPITHQLG